MRILLDIAGAIALIAVVALVLKNMPSNKAPAYGLRLATPVRFEPLTE